jgi:hypothetical protein
MQTIKHKFKNNSFNVTKLLNDIHKDVEKYKNLYKNFITIINDKNDKIAT